MINFLVAIFFIISICCIISTSFIKVEKNKAKEVLIQEQQKQIEENREKLREIDELIKDNKSKRKVLEDKISFYKAKRETLEKEVNDFEDNTNLARQQYIYQLESAMTQAEQEYDETVENFNKKIQSAKEELDKIKKSVNAGNEARLREAKNQENKDFYRLKAPTGGQLRDLEDLFELRERFSEPTVISKIIWSQYFQKQTTDLCNRVLQKVECGIYKITNLNNGLIYIGQSKGLSTRWKNHIKCGLGIDTPSTNKLYQYMLEDKVWNFTFELLEECKPEELNEKEKMWIDIYQANIYGMNTKAGNN